MIRTLCALIGMVVLLKAQQLDAIIAHTLEQHASLQSIEQRLNAADAPIATSQLFANPQLVVGMNDILLSDPLNRSQEPMQTTTVGLKQQIPYFGKRAALKEAAIAKKNVMYHSLEASKVALVREIKLTAYTVWSIQEHLRIVQDLIRALTQSMELYSVYSQTDESSHMQMMSAELSLSELKIKKSGLNKELQRAYARLRYLAAATLEHLDIELHVNQPLPLQYYLSHRENNRKYDMKKAQYLAALKQVRIDELSTKSDPSLQLAYHHREAFDDYLNVSIGVALPIYGRETHRIEASRKEALAASLQQSDWLENITAQLHQEYAALQDAYRVHEIIVHETLPQIEHMFELADAAIRHGADMSDYLELIERKLLLDEQRINAVARYYGAQARLSALIGEKK